MTSLPHTSDPAAIPRLLRMVRNTTTPGSVTAQHLRSNGFNPIEGPRLVGLLRAIKFLDKDNHPTKHWKEYHSSRSAQKVLAAAVRAAYEPLFTALTEAAARNDEEVAGAVRKLTKFNEPHIHQTVSSFRTLCSAAGIGPTLPTTTTNSMLAPRRVRADVLREVAGLAGISAAEFAAAQQAVDNDLLRSAHVAAWNGYVALALMRMAKDDFQALRNARPNWTVSSVEDVAMRIPGSALIDLLVDLELVHADDEFALRQLQQRRNDCAHPTTFAPTILQAKAYVDDVLSRSVVLSQQPIG